MILAQFEQLFSKFGRPLDPKIVKYEGGNHWQTQRPLYTPFKTSACLCASSRAHPYPPTRPSPKA